MPTDEFPLNAKVRTKELDGSTDWNPVARISARPGLTGVVVLVSRGHGICYEVRHDDGSMAYYNPGELEAMTLPGTTAPKEASPTLWERIRA